MSSPVHVVAIATPAPGKLERVKEIFTNLANSVEKSEPDVVKYQLFEQVGGEGVTVLVFQEIYKDQATFEAHIKTPWFQSLGKVLPEENVLAVPLDIKIIKPIAGFASR